MWLGRANNFALLVVVVVEEEEAELLPIAEMSAEILRGRQTSVEPTATRANNFGGPYLCTCACVGAIYSKHIEAWLKLFQERVVTPHHLLISSIIPPLSWPWRCRWNRRPVWNNPHGYY